MRPGQKVVVKWEELHETVQSVISRYHRYNTATVSTWNKASQKMMVTWADGFQLYFTKDQVQKVN